MLDFVKLNGSHYCVDVVAVPGEPVNLKCILFDMTSLWLQQLPIADVVERENGRNPTCIYTEALIHTTLLKEQAASFTLDRTTHGENLLTLNIKHYVANTPVTFEFTLRPGTAKELSEHVMVPLWRTILLLDAKNRALAEQLSKKDIEIEQYRAEGAELKRTTVQTSKFDQQLFDENFPMRLPADNGLDVRRILQGYEQRAILTKTLQLVNHLDEQIERSARIGKAIKRCSNNKWGVKRPTKKWKHQRLDVLCTKIKFPNLPDNPLNSSSTMAERYRMQESDDSV